MEIKHHNIKYNYYDVKKKPCSVFLKSLWWETDYYYFAKDFWNWYMGNYSTEHTEIQNKKYIYANYYIEFNWKYNHERFWNDVKKMMMMMMLSIK